LYIFICCVTDSQREWRLQASHTETIFDCKFSHADRDVFATGSYDGTVKLWSVHGLALQQTLHGCEEIIYCVDFSPDGSVVVCSNILGVLTMWETLSGSGRVVARYIHHSEASYCVSWNKVAGTEDLVASSSSDGTFVVISVDTAALRSSSGPLGSRKKGQLQKSTATPSDIRFSFRHPTSVFGCEWSPTHGHIVATGCSDGVVRVFDTRKNNVLFAECIGHSARVFSIKWSPLLKGYLATGSDDKKVMVWEVPLDFNSDMFDGGNSKTNDRDNSKSDLDDDYPERAHVTGQASIPIKDYTPKKHKESKERSPAKGRRGQQLKPLKVLEGHSSVVRGLCWSHELSSLLMSGSWDATIRLYDIDS
jgi:WD40 repeat protein